MRVLLLGPVLVEVDGDATAIPAPRVRALIARLALDAGHAVPASRLVDDLWPDELPLDSTSALQSVVSRARRVVPAHTITLEPGGYRLTASTDIGEFRHFVDTGDHAAALALWRGDPLADVDTSFADTARRVLDEQRLTTLELDLATRLDDPSAADELVELTTAYPYRDALWALRLRALVVSGNPAEALRVYDEVRRMLADDLGSDPSPELVDLHAQLLRGATPRSRRVLPAAISSFVGRDDEVEQVRSALSVYRLVTITGPGGAGKTRLAIEAARESAETVVGMVELAALSSPEGIEAAILAALEGLDISVLELPGFERAGRRNRLVDVVADLHGILIVDNCEHLIERAAAVVHQILEAAPALRVLATSREPLRIDGERIELLGPLPLAGGDLLAAPAIRLFVDRARAADPTFTPDPQTIAAVADICRHLDGLPLAIELAASRLRTLDVTEVRDRLSDRFLLLTGGSRAALPRHRTLRAVVAWSWDLLDDRERELAERVAVLHGAITRDAAAAMLPGDDVDDLLDALCDKSLLSRTSSGDYLMLETIREYGIDRLVERGVADEVRSLHADFMLAFGAAQIEALRGPGQVAAIRATEAQQGNTIAALQFLTRIGDRPRAVELFASLGSFWLMTNQDADVARWARTIEELPGRGSPEAEMFCAILNAGLALLWATDDDWRPYIDRILEDWERVTEPTDDVLIVMWAISEFGFVDPATLPRPKGEWARAMCHLTRAVIVENRGGLDAVRDDVEAAIEGFRACGDRWGLATATSMRANLIGQDGDLAASLTTWDDAITMLEELGAGEDLELARLRRRGVLMAAADDDALRALRDELEAELRDGAGTSPQAAQLTAMSLARVARLLGDHAHALEITSALMTQRGAGDDLPPIAQAFALAQATQAASLAGVGDFPAAGDALAAAIGTARQTHDMPVISTMWDAAAVCLGSAGEDAMAARLLGAADRLRGRPDSSDPETRRLVAQLRVSLGETVYERERGGGAAVDRDGADALLDEAIQTLRR